MNIIDKIKKYGSENPKKIFALKNWMNLNNKRFKPIDAMLCIFNYAEGDIDTINEIIDQLSEKRKTMGRTQVYSDSVNIKPDIVLENGELVLKGYKPGKELVKKGMKLHDNPKIFRKGDDQVNKTYQKTEERIMDLGAEVRKMYPNADKQFILLAMQAIRRYAAQKKINTKKVVEYLKNHRLAIDDDDFTIHSVANESRIIKIDESMYRLIKEEAEMTEYRFTSNLKSFLRQLLDDPVNAQPTELFKMYGYSRSKLINMLIRNGIVEKDEKISDKDENGEPKTATMMVKFKVPKKDFKHKIKKLYIKLFERNVPSKRVDEDGECGALSAASSGEYSCPVFPMVKREIYGVDESTDTCSVGNYEYDAPVFGDKETLARKNGKGGSVSVNKVRN